MLASRVVSTAATAPKAPAASERIRVFVVDDSSVVRGFVTRLLAAAGDIEVVGTAADGASAIDQLRQRPVDVVILDVEMPVLDGLTALPQILTVSKPGPKVVMASTLTHRGAAISIQALVKGAADYVPKPTSLAGGGAEQFGRDLLERVRIWGAAALRERRAPPALPRPAGSARPEARRSQLATGPSSTAAGTGTASTPPVAPPPIPLGFRPEALAIGCSTGGPQALLKFFGGLRERRLGPIFVTQHMPPTFTTLFAAQLGRASGRPCHEAEDGAMVEKDTIYLAPGDWHMVAELKAGAVRLRRVQTPPENYCRPSVDPMLRSLATIYKDRLLVLILTGMGHDGLAGAREAASHGAVVLAQDEPSSVVWGMPGAVAQAGVAREVHPIDDLAPRVLQLFRSAP